MIRLPKLVRGLWPATPPPAAAPTAVPPPPRAAPAKPVPTPAKAAPAKVAAPKPMVTVVVTALGLEGESLARIVDLTAAECKKAGNRLVVVIDQDDFSPFRGKRVVVEQVVDAEAAAIRAPDLAWTLHRRRQFHLLHERWKPATVACFGRRPDEACLAALKGK